MTDQEILEKAVTLALKEMTEHKPGAVVAVVDDNFPYGMTFIKYEGNQAVVKCKYKGELRFPKEQVFDANRVRIIAMHLKHMGVIPPQGIDCGIITINTKD